MRKRGLFVILGGKDKAMDDRILALLSHITDEDILCTGTSHESVYMKRELSEVIDPEHILQDIWASNTVENFMLNKEYIASYKEITIVTSSSHYERAERVLRTFYRGRIKRAVYEDGAVERYCVLKNKEEKKLNFKRIW